jgi:hypothetical protein
LRNGSIVVENGEELQGKLLIELLEDVKKARKQRLRALEIRNKSFN